jgi:hypothetical protein
MSAPAIGLRPRMAPRNAAIDWQHPLAQGLAFLYVPAVGMFDMVRGLQPSATTGSLVSSPYGLAHRSGSVGTAATFTQAATSHLDFATGQRYSVVGLMSVSSTATFVRCAFRQAYSSEGGNQGWSFEMRSTSDARPGLVMSQMANSFASTYAAGNSGAGVVSADEWAVWAGVSDGTNREVFRNALRVGTASSASISSPTSTLRICANDVTGTAATALVGIWTRALSYGEVAQFNADPFCMLRS